MGIFRFSTITNSNSNVHEKIETFWQVYMHIYYVGKFG